MIIDLVVKMAIAGLLLLPQPIYSQWLQQNPPASRELTDIRFVNTEIGWAVGIDSALFYTETGGTVWERQQGTRSIGRYTGVFPISESVCWAVGWDSLLQRTSDGGHTWQEKTYNGVLFDTTWRAEGIVFADSLNGWISGWYSFSSPESSFVLRTTDGGNKWNKQYLPQRCIGRLMDVIGPTTVWLCCDGFLLGTTDGNSWSTLTGNPYDTMYDVDFVTSQIGWRVYQAYPAGSIIARSDDGGISWSQQLFFAMSGGYTYIKFMDSLRGWVATESGGNLVILHTEDGGENWSEQFSENDMPLGFPQRIYFSDSANGWVATNTGNIIHTDDGGITSVDDEETSIRSTNAILFPNPFTSSTTLKYRLDVGSDVRFIVYDLLGRTVFEYSDPNKIPGEYAFNLDFGRISQSLNRKIASGVYYCHLMVAKHSVMLPMIFVR